ncbi:LuxR C-terminal-related transcriptional regulator [Mycobacterium intracellulare]|uniref:LuxR C-terminal-related transcriptional regulator n=3 Tax=Mycobacterium intracellulare TaxID=1767 RepID=A0AAE4UDH7_MYCIT|nr:LuxR C-terminal-related transcriptional regulator [Mycobacterium intracellulare]MDV6978028.1 LuxR C-terminal-related transcriptional regulator [Mycobacterium intracellulare]MDV6983442.1 LuxR C-terminal-related transcriptional regulator [Mycobacterium intracellulare]MDV7012193.1 LuxR C-terminal-related transcriptional regulator [Mycobacterium intracellulare]MDV7027131.1 LuxR C-terminal-related transcriptional regulator [Mycobacterium intracellulare]
MNGSAGRGDNEAREAPARAVLLATKLHVPAVGAQLVHRAALLDALSAGRTRKLTLLSAPAGWGKTTLLAQWVLGAGEDERFAWLSLDSSDNDPVWFWMYVVGAVQKVSPGVGIRAVELLAMGADPVQVVLPTLLNDLDTIASPMVLILDDYHLVVRRAVHEQLAFFISRMPANLHLVLATRSDPTLPLARLRASGELAEVRTDDLRFGPIEADHLLNDVLGLGLATGDIQLLHRRTEGWAAGLYLAALSLAGRADTAAFIRTFAGDNRHIVDYLMAEVLDGQPPHLRSFLLRTSVLGRLSGALCDAVLQTSGSASVLEEIERENLFVVPLDTSRHWYRYHQLFGELLRTELRRTEPDLVAELHRRAATWFQGEGLIDEAVRHLLAAGDIARSADLIAADWVDEFNGGGLSTISGYLDLLPEETVLQDPRLSVARAWIALSTGQLDDAAEWIEAVETHCAADTADGRAISAQVVVLRAVHSFKTADVAAALETAARAIALDFGEAPLGRSSAYCIYGSALYFSGRTPEAQAALRRAVQLAEKVGDRRARVYALGYLALISTERGELADAERQIRRASGSSRDLAQGEHFVDGMVSLAAAELLAMRGDATAAATAADMAVMSARQGGAILEMAKALLVRAETCQHLGDHQTAKAILDEVSTLVRDSADVGIASTLLASAERSAGVALSSRTEARVVAEELTPKELEVLRLLATRLSRREIGERLYVSLNTVKTHQRAVYRKLGVEHRGAAVSRARELGLL